MSQEYGFSNKELVLEALSSQDFDNTKYIPIYQMEVEAIKNGENSSDFLEILPWSQLGKISELLNSMITTTQTDSETKQPPSKYDKYCHEQITRFSDDLRLLLNSVDTKARTKSYLLTSRKTIGLARNTDDLQLIANALLLANKAESMPQKDDLFLIQYPGAFLPFPHKAHLELTQKAFGDISLLHFANCPRIVVNTFEKNAYRFDETPAFFDRIKVLHMGFALQDFVTVLGVSGDSDRQFKQMEIISKFSSDKKINYLCGSDTIIKKVNFALNGDIRAQKFFDQSTNFWISLRPGENVAELNLAIDLAQKMEGAKISILPSVRDINISGTQIRENMKLGSNVVNVFPNTFIEEIYSN